jgi:hypothetical protein
MWLRCRLALAQILPIDHPTATVYVDETGWAKTAPFFGIGALLLQQPETTLSAFRDLREETKCHQFLRWADIHTYGDAALALVRSTLAMLATGAGVTFTCFLADHNRLGGPKGYGGRETAYNLLAGLALIEAIDEPDQLACVLADQFDVTRGMKIESQIISRVNATKGRLAIVSMQRLRSNASEGLQLVDLLLGAVAYQVRAKAQTPGPGPKLDISRALMTEGYSLTAYYDASGGRVLPGRLHVQLLPRPGRRRGARGRAGRAST